MLISHERSTTTTEALRVGNIGLVFHGLDEVGGQFGLTAAS